MISLYSSTDPTHAGKLAVTYNGLTLNSPTDPLDDTYELEAAFPKTDYATIADERATGDGSEIYEARKVLKAYRLLGRVKAPTYERLYDKVETLAKTFDPSLLSFNNASVQGFLPLDFTTLSVAGSIAGRYYARPLTTIDRMPHKFDGLAFLFTIDLIMRDPRRYRQTTASQTGAGTLAAVGDYPSPATVTITMAGAGSATYSVSNTATVQTKSLVLNLSGLSNGNVVIVNMDARTITVGGTDTMSLYVSGDYWMIEPGNNAIALANTTNATTVVSYRPAWSL
jgi:hypothetical protein